MTPDPLPYHHSFPPVPPHITIARRAGSLMVALGIFILLGGGCLLLGSTVPENQFPADTQASIHQLESQSHVSIHAVIVAMGIILAVIGLYQIIMGLFVRRGGKGTILAALIITTLITTLWAFQLFAAVVSGNAPNLAAGAGVMLITVCLMVWQLAWLFQAFLAARRAPSDPVLAGYPQQFAQPGQFVYPPLPPQPEPVGWPYPPPPPPAAENRVNSVS